MIGTPCGLVASVALDATGDGLDRVLDALRDAQQGRRDPLLVTRTADPFARLTG